MFNLTRTWLAMAAVLAFSTPLFADENLLGYVKGAETLPAGSWEGYQTFTERNRWSSLIHTAAGLVLVVTTLWHGVAGYRIYQRRLNHRRSGRSWRAPPLHHSSDAMLSKSQSRDVAPINQN